MAQNVAETTRKISILETDSPLFAAIKGGDTQTVLQMLSENQGLLKATNSNGAYPVHVAFLFSHIGLGKELITRYPEVALQKYAEGDYEGENVLHMAIINEREELLDWLLQRHPDLLNAETVGKFFAPGGGAYFGSLPLLFAVSTNQPHMVQRIMATTSSSANLQNNLWCRDHHGNTALHMSVVHDLPDMCKYILSLESQSKGPNDTTLVLQMNDEGLTPLALAAAMGRVKIFKMLLAQGTKVAWVYGPIQCNLVPLRGLDQPLNAKHSSGGKVKRLFKQGKETAELRNETDRLAVHCMCAPERERLTKCLPKEVPEEVMQGRLEMAMLPEIRQLLHQKWKTFGRRRFLLHFIPVALMIVFWTTALIIPKQYWVDSEYIFEYPVNNGWILACESCVMIWVIWIVLKEILRLIRAKKSYLRGHHGIMLLIWWLQIIFCALVFAIIGLRATFQYVPQIICTAIASVVGWILLLAHLVAFESTGPLIILIEYLLRGDFRKFFIVYMVILIGFTTAINLVRNWEEEPALPNQIRYFLTFRDMLIMGMVGKLLIEETFVGVNAWLLCLLLLLYLIVQVVIMVSILISMLVHTYEEINEQAHFFWVVQRNNMLRYLETEVSTETVAKKRREYSVQLHEGDLKDGDPDLYLEVLTTKEDWKHEIRIEGQPLLESQGRAEIRNQESTEWQALVERMGRVGIYLRSPAVMSPSSLYGKANDSDPDFYETHPELPQGPYPVYPSGLRQLRHKHFI